MSATNPPAEPTDGRPPEPPVSSEPQAAPATAKPRRWRRRFVRLFLLTVALLLVVRLSVPLWLPTVVARAGALAGLDVRYGQLDLSLLAGDLELRDLSIAMVAAEDDPSGIPTPLCDVDYLAADLAVLDLFRGDLRVRRLALGRAEVWLERDEAGTWKLPDVGGDDEPEAAEETGAEDAPAEGPADFRLPLHIDRIDVGALGLFIEDRADGRSLELEADAELVDIGHPTEPGRLLLRARAPGLFESLRLEGHLTQTELELAGLAPEAERPRELALDFTLGLVDLDAGAAGHWTRDLGLGAVARELDSGLSGSARVFATDLTGAARAEVELTGLEGRNDGQLSAGFTSLVLGYDFGGPFDRLGPVALHGLNFEAGRSRDGRLFALGFELFEAAAIPIEAAAADAAADAAAEMAGDTASASDPVADPALADLLLDGLILADSRLAFHDAAAGVELELQIERAEVGPLDLVGGQGREAELGLRLSAPGLFEALELDGLVRVGGPAGQAQELSGRLHLDGLEPTVLAPYLAAAGVEWQAGATTLTLGFEAQVVLGPDGGLDIEASLRDLELRGERRLVGLGSLEVRGLRLGPGGDLEVDELLLDGPALVAARDAAGVVSAAGLRFAGVVGDAAGDAVGAGSPEPAAPSPSSVASAGAASAQPARIRVGRIAVTGADLVFRDSAVEPSLLLSPSALDFELTGLDLFGPAPVPATLRARFAQAGLAEELVLSGSIEGSGAPDGSLDVSTSFEVHGRGLTSELLAAHLTAAGLGGALVGGELDLAVVASLGLDAAGDLSAGLNLSGLSLKAQLPGSAEAVELAGLDRLAFDSLGVGAGGVSASAITIEGPRLRLERDLDGRLGFGGLLLLGTEAVAVGPAVAAQPSAAAPVAPKPGAAAPARAPAVDLAGLSLSGVELTLADASLAQPLVLDLDLELGGFDLSAPAPTDLHVELGVAGMLGGMTLDLELLPDLSAPSASGALALRGIDGAGLAELLPEGLEVTLVDGRLDLDVDASVDLTRPGDLGLNLELGELELSDGEASLLAFERLAVHLASLSAERVDLEELAIEGLVLDARRTSPERLEAAGLALVSLPASGPVGTAAEGSQPTAEPAPTPGAPSSTSRPLVRVERVTLELERLGWLDATRQGAEPMDLSLVFQNMAPFERDLDDEPEDSGGLNLNGTDGALRFELVVTALPAMESLRLELALDPFAVDPHLGADLAVTGVSGAGLLAALPELAELLDASAIEGGSLVAKLDAGLRVRRRGPLEFDLGAGVGGDFEVTGIAWRPRPDAEVELGLDRLAGELVSAGAEGVLLSSLELERPIGRVTLESRGLRVGGWLLLATAPEAPASPVAQAPASDVAAGAVAAAEAPAHGPQAAAAASSVAAQPATPARFPIEVRELSLSGLDFVLRDERVSPPMVLPLDDLELEVRGLNTAALDKPLPISFKLFVDAGYIEVKERHEAANLVSGLFGAVGGVLTGGEDDFETVLRPAFGGLDAAGRLTLFPAPKGWVSLELGAVELPNYRGVVAESGIDLGDGLLDLELDVRLLGERGMAVTTTARATHLSLSEPPGGPISTYLKLPAPLDTVLFLLRDENGEQVLPLSFRVAADGGLDGVGSAIAKTLGLLVGEAIASSPLRLVGGVLDMTGLIEDQLVELPEELFAVGFLPGSPEQADWPLLARIQPVIELLKKDRTVELDLTHVFTGADLERLGKLVVPDPSACRALVTRLRRERDVLIVERDRLAVNLRTDYALGVAVGVEGKHRRLANLDAELALLEESLDGALEFLRPGSERRSARRTRAAALLVAEERLEVVRAALASLSIPAIGERLRVRRARLGELVEAEAGGSVYLLPRR